MNKQRGFSLIELMLVVAIIGIVAVIAVPAYQEQSLKAKRSDGQATLLTLQGQMERFYFDNNSYPNGLSQLNGIATNSVLSEDGYYTVSMNIDAGCPIATCFELVATAGPAQLADGDLELHSNGTKLPADRW